MCRFDEAIEATREALCLDPNHVSALTALGFALLERGDLDEALASMKRSIELRPDPQTHSNVMMAVNYHPAYTPAEHLAAHRGWAELHEKPHMARWKPHDNDRSPDRRSALAMFLPISAAIPSAISLGLFWKTTIMRILRSSAMPI